MHVAVDPRRMAVPASVMVAASLIGLLATACTGSSPAPARSTSAQGVPPIRYAAGVFDCPADHFVHVFGGHVYPMGYPARPPASARPDRCFETPQDAFAAGKSPALTPRTTSGGDPGGAGAGAAGAPRPQPATSAAAAAAAIAAATRRPARSAGSGRILRLLFAPSDEPGLASVRTDPHG